MKKSILLVGLSFALFAISSCDKNYDIETKKTISVVADATLSGQVKTSISHDNVNGYSSDWDNEDVLGFYYLEEGSAGSAGANNKGTLNLGSVVDGVRGSFTGSITSPGESTEYVFNAYYPSNANNNIENSLKLNQFRFTVPDVQNPLKDGFDPNADILVARPVKKTVNPTDESISLDFNFERVVSIVRISFPTIVYDGVSGDEKIMQVVLSKVSKSGNTDDNIIAGRMQVTPSEGASSLSSFSNLDSYNLHTITANYTEETAPTLSDGSVYLTMVPRTFVEGDQLTVTVVTNKHTITKVSTIPSGQSLECPANAVKHLKINITESAENLEVNDVAKVYYEKVTSAPADWSGTYLIVCEEAGVALTGSGSDASSIKVGTSVAISENRIGVSGDVNSVSIEKISDLQYLIQTTSGYYIYTTASGTGLSASTKSGTADDHPVALSFTDGTISIIVHDKHLSYYNSSNFGFYTTNPHTQADDNYVPIQLYKRSENL